MKTKLINLFLLLTSLIGYLEWGGNNHMFLVQGEYEILTKLFTDPLSVLHPFVILPIAGQLVLAITLFQNKPNKVLTLSGLIGLGILLLFIFVVGIIGMNWKVAVSALPFLVTSFVAVKNYRNS